MRIPGGAGGGSPGTTALARTIKKATDLAKRHPTINAASKSFAEFAAWTAVGDAAVGAYNYVAGADEEQGEGTEYGTISTAAAKVDDAIAKLKAAEGTADESQAVKDLEKELGKATSEAKSVVGKQKQQMKKIGGMKLKGAQTLQAAGFGKGVDPGENHRKIYDEFYAKIDAAGLNSVLGKKDYLFGKKHQAALSALKSKKPAVKDKPSTDVKIAGTQAANVAAKVAKKIKSVARFTYKSPGEAIRAAAGGILDPGYADNPSVKAALEKFKQS